MVLARFLRKFVPSSTAVRSGRKASSAGADGRVCRAAVQALEPRLLYAADPAPPVPGGFDTTRPADSYTIATADLLAYPLSDAIALHQWRARQVIASAVVPWVDGLVNDTNPKDVLANSTYDAQRVLYQHQDATGDPAFGTYARNAGTLYHDYAAAARNDGGPGNLPEHFNYTGGLTMQALRGEDADGTRRQLAIDIAHNAAFSRDWTNSQDTVGAYATNDDEQGRALAWAMFDRLDAARLMEDPRWRGSYTDVQRSDNLTRLRKLVEFSIGPNGHFDQWFGDPTASPAVPRSADYVKPFMVGVQAMALARYHAVSGDPRVLPKLERAGEVLSQPGFWSEGRWLFHYLQGKMVDEQGKPTTETVSDPTGVANDLNQLIAPVYAWLRAQTNDPTDARRADRAFIGGATQAYLAPIKQFDQAYLFGPEFLTWRTGFVLDGRTVRVTGGNGADAVHVRLVRSDVSGVGRDLVQIYTQNPDRAPAPQFTVRRDQVDKIVVDAGGGQDALTVRGWTGADVFRVNAGGVAVDDAGTWQPLAVEYTAALESVAVDGGGPTAAPGDEVVVGTGGTAAAGTTAGAGTVTFAGRTPITYAGIEKVTNPATVPPGAEPAVLTATFNPAGRPHVLRVTFDESVKASLDAATGGTAARPAPYLRLVNLSTGRSDFVARYDWYSTSTNTADFTFPREPNAVLPAGSYRVTIDRTGVRDADNNPMAADFVYQFTASPAADPPVVTAASFNPAGRPHVLRVTFDESVKASLDAAAGGSAPGPAPYLRLVNLSTGRSDFVAQRDWYSTSSNRVDFTFPREPNAVLPAGTYRATLDRTGVRDTDGNLLTTDFIFNFTV